MVAFSEEDVQRVLNPFMYHQVTIFFHFFPEPVPDCIPSFARFSFLNRKKQICIADAWQTGDYPCQWSVRKALTLIFPKFPFR
jgi:hypothetical protein